MTIHVDKEQEWDPFVKKVMDKLDEILRYQKNFDSEIFDSFSRLEEKIDLIKSNTELIVKESGKKKVK